MENNLSSVPLLLEEDIHDIIETYKETITLEAFKEKITRYTRFSNYKVLMNEIENYYAILLAMEDDIANVKRENV